MLSHPALEPDSSLAETLALVHMCLTPKVSHHGDTYWCAVLHLSMPARPPQLGRGISATETAKSGPPNGMRNIAAGYAYRLTAALRHLDTRVCSAVRLAVLRSPVFSSMQSKAPASSQFSTFDQCHSIGQWNCYLGPHAMIVAQERKSSAQQTVAVCTSHKPPSCQCSCRLFQHTHVGTPAPSRASCYAGSWCR